MRISRLLSEYWRTKSGGTRNLTMPFPGKMDGFRLNIVLFGMAGSRKSSLIRSSNAWILLNLQWSTGRESATILESCDLPNDVKIHERRGFFDLNEVEQGIKLILNGLVFPLIFLGIIVNKLTHRYIVVHVSEFGCDRDLAKPVFRQLATLELRITIWPDGS